MTLGADFSLSAASLAIRRGLELLDADPLANWLHASEKHAFATAHLGKAEMYIHSSNKWGKTTLGAAWGVALARGKRELDGVPLPRLRLPNIGLVLSLDYNQQKDSVQKAYLDAIGSHPHKCEWDGEILKSVRVKPDDSLSDDPREWSVIRFVSQENRRSGVGTRCDWCHCDEPPRMEILREVRKAGVPGWPFPVFITATPIKRNQWAPLRGDYPLSHEGRIYHPTLPDGRTARDGYLRIRGDLEDVRMVPGKRGGFLTDADIDSLHVKYATDPDRVQRLTGQEINTSGASPWRAQYAELQRWLDDCRAGEQREWKVSREVPSEGGKKLVTELVDVEMWADPVRGHVYRVILDPSLGIDDGKHDPCEALVWDMTAREQVALYSGYIGEYGLGVLGAGLSKWYGDCPVDPAVTGGYGSGLLTGLRVAGCRTVTSRTRAARKGERDRTDIGFTESRETRVAHASAIREALVWSAAGESFMRVRSARQVAELMDIITGDDGEPLTADDLHDEALVTLGRIAVLTKPTKGAPVVREVPVRTTPRDAWRTAQGLPKRLPEKMRRLKPMVPR